MTLPLALRLAAGAWPRIVSPGGEIGAGATLGLSPKPRIGARVLVSIREPLRLVESLIALDGRVAAILLVSYAQPAEVALAQAEAAGCDAIVTDRADLTGGGLAPLTVGGDAANDATPVETRWLMTTSGTTGVPKIIPHTLESLAATVRPAATPTPPRWALLYDPTRFAGLQVTLQALIGGGVLIAPDASAPLGQQLDFLARNGCDHLSATPTLWRRLLMTPTLAALGLKQITLGGEIADQSVLDALRASCPGARITHVYASTEAGVGFSVKDGRAGFPASYLTEPPQGVALKLVDGMLWLRPRAFGGKRLADPAVVVDAEGFILSGDLVERVGERVIFLGRESGVINVGGVKIHPEMVEREIVSVPGVALARISAKKSPLTGQLIVAEVAARPDVVDLPALKAAILNRCRERLEREACPAVVRFVDDMEINAAGKLIRGGKG